MGANSVLYFKVTDVDAVHSEIVARGSASEHSPQLVAKMPDHELWIGFVRDPDGNLIGLMEEKRSGRMAEWIAPHHTSGINRSTFIRD